MSDNNECYFTFVYYVVYDWLTEWMIDSSLALHFHLCVMTGLAAVAVVDSGFLMFYGSRMGLFWATFSVMMISVFAYENKNTGMFLIML